jgi:hypothetical protein
LAFVHLRIILFGLRITNTHVSIFAEQRYNIPGRVVALPYLPSDEPGKGFAATPRQVPSLGGRKPEFITEP